jgi:hypothetical protein
MSAKDYINTSQLNCVTWIDGTDITQLSTVGSTFTAKNKMGDTRYDFIQPVPSLHPLSGNDGLSFIDSRRLYPRQSDIFSNLDISSYSIIFVTKGNSTISQQLLAIAKTPTDRAKLLDIRHRNGKSVSSFSNVNIESFQEYTPFSGDVQFLSLSHNIRLGNTSVSIDKNPFVSLSNTSKGYLLNNFPSSFYLGNASTNLPFVGELLHFLLFIPAISNAHLSAISNLLGSSRPVLSGLSSEYTYDSNYLLDLSISNVVTPTIRYNSPIVELPLDTCIPIDLTCDIVLSFYYIWDNLENSDWDNLDVSYWDNLD